MIDRRRHIAALALAVALAALTMPASAAPRNTGVPNAMQGFSQNRDQPVHIEAATLEVRDKQSVAVFSGNVHVVQGDTDMRCKSLVVFYEAAASKAPVAARKNTPAAPARDAKANMLLPQMGETGQRRVRRLEARGGVVVKRNNQLATGRTGIFDMKSNTVTLVGDVVVSQGPNVIRGDHLVVDLKTGVSRIESGKRNGGRVRALLQPSSTKSLRNNEKPAPTPPQPAPGQPLKLN
jgi:lipopolysaccharide export system protein LptA